MQRGRFPCRLLHGEDTAIRMYDEIYPKVKDSLDAGTDAQEVILNALLGHNGTKVSPLTVITQIAFLSCSGILFDALHFGPEKRWVYTDRDHELGAPTRFLLDMNQYFVITLSAESASKLNKSHLEGLWQMIRVLSKCRSSFDLLILPSTPGSSAEDRAICAAIHKTLEMIIDTEGPEEGLQLYPRFAGALDEMLETHTRIGWLNYKPLSPVTSLLLRIAARRDRYHLFLRIGIKENDPEAYELFMNAIPDAPTSRDEDAIARFVDSFAKGVARSTSPEAVKTWKDEAARKRCADWFLDRERFASLVRQARHWADSWERDVLDVWHPRPDTWYYEEVKNALSEWEMDKERREAERQAQVTADDSPQAESALEGHQGHESTPASHSGGPADASQPALVVDGERAGFEYYFRRIRDFFGVRRRNTRDTESGTQLVQM
ncbi:hypothetical protein CYLTODRAFT_89133 [Cylindrobasidium torrendii FP15055 ss-10]|uniref:Uncharacterized protein n=1 Tax=Cylindrobasidium torrendii FP15055 ss-10 TaxID=1314674 RepID=A0A0D7B285_9AGAR|nr:hypothetical protein CYLTODRAFT_89133 [Cylindrobasidium torrendii FP15055 ss-10]